MSSRRCEAERILYAWTVWLIPQPPRWSRHIVSSRLSAIRVAVGTEPGRKPANLLPLMVTRIEMTPTRQKRPRAVMASATSADPSAEHDHSTPQSPGDIIRKGANEARAEHGIWNKVEAVGRELDRNIGGEYARREDQTPPRFPGESRIDAAPVERVRGSVVTRVLVPSVSRTKLLVIAGLVMLICIIAVVAFVALRANPSTHPGQGDRQYTISPIQPDYKP